MDEKLFVSADQLLTDSFVLGKKIYDAGLQPDFLVGLWRGGAPVGIAVQEFLSKKGVNTDHIPIRTQRYDNRVLGVATQSVKVYGLEYIAEQAQQHHTVLLVDDVFDTGLTLHAVIQKLGQITPGRTPSIKIATVYYKPTKNETQLNPDFYVHETDRWVVFPHEVNGLTAEEIEKGKGSIIARLLK